MSNSAHIFFSSHTIDDTLQKIDPLLLVLNSLENKNIPIHHYFIIPKTTILEIAAYNHLYSFFSTVFSSIQWQNKQLVSNFVSPIQEKILGMKIPDQIALSILRAYHELNQNDSAYVRCLHQLDQTYHKPYVTQGDANLVHTILESWAKSITVSNLWQLSKLTQAGDHVPQAFIIQPIPQIQASGVTSLQMEQDQKTIHIWSEFGSGHSFHNQDSLQYYQLDHNTRQIVFHKHKHSETKQTQSLTKALHETLFPQLPPIIKHISQATNKPISLEWQINAINQFSINHISSYTPTLKKKNSLPTPSKVMLGKKIVAGSAAGNICYLSKRILQSNEEGQILITKRLTPRMLPLATQAKALLVEEHPARSFILLLQKHNVPTLQVSSIDDFHNQKNITVSVDASRGKIHIIQKNQKKSQDQKKAQKEKNEKHHENKSRKQKKPKILAISGNPATTTLVTQQQHNGLFFKSEYVLDYLNLNPNQLLNKKHQSEFAVSVNSIIRNHVTSQLPKTLFYQSMSIIAHDQNTQNPYLGNRGVAHFLPNISLLHMEINIIKQLVEKYSFKVTWVAPMVRTKTEWMILLQAIEKYSSSISFFLDCWLEIDTPQNILQPNEYQSSKNAGFVINLTHIHSLLFGIDPNNPSIWSQYPLDIPLLTQLISTFKKHSHHKKVYVLMDTYNRDLVQQLHQIVDGYILNPKHIPITTQLLDG